jgi:hypothetical protein
MLKKRRSVIAYGLQDLKDELATQRCFPAPCSSFKRLCPATKSADAKPIANGMPQANTRTL